ncbi:MAG: DUF485 domain-containing protein [bacterium]|nr:DUF485 domain-containing protein [bacterium]
MLHGEAVKLGKDEAVAFKTRIGVILFVFYSLVYAGFVAINTLSPKSMGVEVLFGLNLAVVYGFGLIILAIVMGIIYNHVCTKMEDKLSAAAEKAEKSEEAVD